MTNETECGKVAVTNPSKAIKSNIGWEAAVYILKL